MPIRNKIKQFLHSRQLTAYRLVKDTGISDTTGYRLAADSTYVPSVKILKAICETYKVQPGEILEWFETYQNEKKPRA